ncbi:MAG: ribonuclease III [Oscillospiraceae bacterium]|nr:ribonuclease III [Oscillospiraceae bacterium]MBQ2792571.1 ribonuclease III [Oscillospiraceae bacterium]
MNVVTDLSLFQEKLGYHFHNVTYLTIALTHSSFANEGKKGDVCNERQEFLGDAVLSIIVSDYLFRNHAKMPEGDLTKLRAALVCEKALCLYAEELGLGDFLMLGRGEEATGGRQRPSILADAFEAVIAAIYLDGGIEPAREFVLRYVVPTIGNHTKVAFKDYKTILQEIIQKNPEERVTYELVEESGPDHNKRFVVEVHLNSNVIGRGEGRSKKSAEQAAAQMALELMGQ